MFVDVIYAGGIYSATQKLIEHSEKEIIVISPWFDLEGHIKESLLGRLRKGVTVVVITREPNSKNHKDAVSELKKNGALIFYDKLLHAKVLLSDREFTILGSANLQASAMQKNHELAIMSEEDGVIGEVMSFIGYLEGALGIDAFSHADEKFESSIIKVFKKLGEKFKKVADTEKICPRCKNTLVIREGKRGKFYGCNGFPKCRYTEDYE